MLSHTDHIQFTSEKVNYTYDIRVFVPEGEIPPGGYSVYYVLDGNSYFQIARDVVKLQSRNAPKTHIDPAIVIGIGHQESDCSQKRFHDFTAISKEYIYPPRLKGKGGDLGSHGGAENFLAFVEEELKPYVKMHYPIDASKQCLFGHSLAGYFTLWVKFTRPELFQAYLSSSPSVWWNDHELLMYAQKYAVNTTVAIDNNVLITVGGEEGFMVEDAEKLTQVLQKHQRPVEMYTALEENHSSVVPSVMSRMFRFGCSQVKEE
ncbi:hypothetical protein PGLA_26045 [Paenibacillus glacialis]|uniref:Alpha/beta hydrolase n=1 Tax=Paenibacillus glacialis TaxID=494026 RepID=A0A168C490_9BACL|nr:hypothetical protein PGLA_26045 [Paenibacillus glacialis]